jgi:predicted negative regulator of RcsB-dependent stress response
MADERGDSRFSSFLVGFLIGLLLTGGGVGGYCIWQERILARVALTQQAYAQILRMKTEKARQVAQAARKAADAERQRAEEALRQLQEK